MKIQSQNENLSSKSLTILFLIVCYWFYLNIYLGFFLSKIFYNFFDNIEWFNWVSNQGKEVNSKYAMRGPKYSI